MRRRQIVHSRSSRRAPALALSLLALTANAAAQGVPDKRWFRDMPDIQHSRPEAQCPRGIVPSISGNTVSVGLEVAYADYELYNPWTDSFDKVHLRSYNGCPTGPVVNVQPGNKLKIRLDNKLPATEPNFECPPADALGHHGPHCFNSVNLHTHGLHVSPKGNSDNVFVRIDPGKKFQYEYDLPRNHPAGTFWYHAHLHGSTALQVSSGAAGVLVVRGNRRVQDKARNHGVADIDTLLKDGMTRRPLREQTMLFQQVEYGCFDGPPAMTNPPQAPKVSPTTGFWDCPAGYVGELRNYNNQVVIGSWDRSGRFTSINGVVQPLMPRRGDYIAAGEIQRWRLVHGGVRDRINVKIVKADLRSLMSVNALNSPTDATLDQGLSGAVSRMRGARTKLAQQMELANLCKGEVVGQLEFAVDGMTRTVFSEKQVNTLHPGQRSDVLVAFPSPGLYCVIDEEAAVNATSADANAGQLQPKLRFKDRKLLSFARVGFGPGVVDVAPDGYGRSKYWQHVRNRLVHANPDLPPAVKQDLTSLKIAEYAPIKDIVCPPQGCDTRRNDEYTINFTPPSGPGLPPTLAFGINGLPFVGNPGDPAYPTYAARNYFKPVLGRTQEWTITGGFEHIFHVHVNAFQIADVLDPTGVSIYKKNTDQSLYRNALGLSECTDAAKQAFTNAQTGAVDTQYCDQGGVVRDTVVQLGGPFVPGRPPAGYKVVMRTRYEDFTGRFVMHCHILDHEDEGMMMDVEIVSPMTAALNSVLDPMKRSVARAESALEFAGILPGKRQSPSFLDDVCTALGVTPLRAGVGSPGKPAASLRPVNMGTSP